MFFFFNDTATTEIYTLSLHDALPIYALPHGPGVALWSQRDLGDRSWPQRGWHPARREQLDRKSTRLNSSHGYISYAVFCLKKKKVTRVIFTMSPRMKPSKFSRSAADH